MIDVGEVKPLPPEPPPGASNAEWITWFGKLDCDQLVSIAHTYTKAPGE